ncbi:uncharacterized protein FIESC28_04081 [Fusarium coffeatum]|uniref:Uncharacterized protein n=1 Tax=Fusarium coffeatum TaxID=231269 RepID=A0A366S2V9_9HYPO|nr:uncharacterized protein FIESC28_04081 [Fusarium coffeatum]RBR23086.1 hypothetical protein FIESC28_04081 [Fusarium coffeatum]
MRKMEDTCGRPGSFQDQPRDETQMLKDAPIDELQELKLQNQELRNTNDFLRSELRRATNKIKEHIAGAEDVESSKRELGEIVEERSKCIAKLNQDKHDLKTKLESAQRQYSKIIDLQDKGITELLRERVVATMRIKDLERNQTPDSALKRSSTTVAENEAKRLKREQTLEATKRAEAEQSEVVPYCPQPVTPTITAEVKEEHSDSYMTSDDEQPSVPGLPLVEYCLSGDVATQLTEIMKNPKRKRRLESFLEHGRKDTWFCAHKVLRKGEKASTPVLPKEACPSQNCKQNFRVMVVNSDSGVKLFTAPYTRMD